MLRGVRAAALALPVLLSACGTTVPTGAPAVTGAAPLELSTPTPGTQAAPAERPSYQPQAARVVADSAATRDRASATDEVVGVVGGTVRVGTYYFDSESTNALIGSIGASNEMGDMRAQQRAVASWINSHGGVAGGRRIELVQHQVDIQADPSTEAESLCAAWTQDRGVFAGVGSLPTTNDVLVSCLAKARTLSIGGSSSNVGTAADFRRWAPYYYAPASIELVSAGRVYAEGLLSQGFFPKDARVGVVYVESAQHEAALREGLLPRLAKAGVRPVQLAPIAYDGSFADYGNLVTRVQSTTLRFRSADVSHVLFVDTGGALAFWFMQQAQSQGYTPRYGLSTLSAPAFQEANVDARQLRDAVAVGWRPADDVSAASAFPANPARQLCQRIMSEAGLPARSAFDLQLQLTTCSGLFFLRTALDRSAALTPAAFQVAVSGLGTRDPSASGFVDRYGPGKSWGGSGYGTLRFLKGCDCFRYTGRRSL